MGEVRVIRDDEAAGSTGGGAAGYDRVPPHNLDAEASVIGSMLLSKAAIAEVTEVVGAEDFYRGAHRTMFEAVLDLYNRGEPADSVTLADELERRTALADVGGVPAIAELVSRVPTAANALYYARIVSDHAVRRRLIDAGTVITRYGYESADDVDAAVDRAEATIYQVAQRGQSSEFTPMKDLLAASFEMIERLHENDSAITGLATGFHDLDDLTAGLQPGNLVILAARPAMGKSTLVTNIATHVAVMQRRPAILFSLEMSQMELVQRILAGEGRVDSERLRTGRLQESDWPKLSQAIGKLAEAPLFIDDTPGLNLMELRSKARRLKQKHGLDLVIVDYLQLMQSHRRVDSRVQEVAEFSRGLKVLAKELEIPVLALSQLSRKPEDRTDRRPQLSDLRESGCLTADARVLRADTGAEVPIGQLYAEGARNVPVWTLSRDGGFEPGCMTHVFCSGVKPVFALRLRSGREVRASGNHPFLTPQGWAPLEGLEVGQVVAVPGRVPEPTAAEAWAEDEVAGLGERLGRMVGAGGVKRDHVSQDLLPSGLFTLKDAQLAGFLRRLWGAAGATWALRTRSPALAHGLQLLLARLGVDAVVRRTGRLELAGPSARALFLRDVMGQEAAHREAMGSQVMTPELVGVGAASSGRGAGSGMLPAARGRAGFGQEGGRFRRTDVAWDTVTAIAPLGEQRVFDATVRATHNFVANNIVVHNSIEQDADLVCFIYRDEVYNPDTEAKGEAELIVAKHRNGPLRTIRLSFLGHHSRFADMARTGAPPGGL